MIVIPHFYVKYLRACNTMPRTGVGNKIVAQVRFPSRIHCGVVQEWAADDVSIYVDLVSFEYILDCVICKLLEDGKVASNLRFASADLVLHTTKPRTICSKGLVLFGDVVTMTIFPCAPQSSVLTRELEVWSMIERSCRKLSASEPAIEATTYTNAQLSHALRASAESSANFARQDAQARCELLALQAQADHDSEQRCVAPRGESRGAVQAQFVRELGAPPAHLPAQWTKPVSTALPHPQPPFPHTTLPFTLPPTLARLPLIESVVHGSEHVIGVALQDALWLRMGSAVMEG